MKHIYYMTWDEKKHGRMYSYIVCGIPGDSTKQVREQVYWPEQNYRSEHGLPHMFHVQITAKVPCDHMDRDLGHLYY